MIRPLIDFQIAGKIRSLSSERLKEASAAKEKKADNRGVFARNAEIKRELTPDLNSANPRLTSPHDTDAKFIAPDEI